MNENLEPKMSNFFVANLRNSWLLRAICALNLNILNLNLFRPDLIRGSLGLYSGTVQEYRVNIFMVFGGGSRYC
jgi:hypothetical protein